VPNARTFLEDIVSTLEFISFQIRIFFAETRQRIRIPKYAV
jgi:hypothetical protein